MFVVDNFDGTIFQELRKHHCRIVGPSVITRCVMYDEVGNYCSCYKTVVKSSDELVLLHENARRLNSNMRLWSADFEV